MRFEDEDEEDWGHYQVYYPWVIKGRIPLSTVSPEIGMDFAGRPIQYY